MKRNFLKVLTVLSFAIIMSIGSVQNASAVFELFDGKVEVSGFLKETAYYKIAKFDREYRRTNNRNTTQRGQGQSSRLDFLMTAGYLETLVHIKEDPFGWNVRLFTGLRYFWEKAPDIDKDQHRAIADYHYKRYRTPRNFYDDMLTEFYVDVQKGPWQVKVGKQIVIWGQNDIGRVADVVNPLKLTHGVPGVDTWEEVKQGLWMVRAFYQSNLPGNLLFEVIFNPGDHRYGDFFGYSGTHWGEPYALDGGKGIDAGVEAGMGNFMLEGARRANQTWDFDEDYSFGGRIMGQTGNFNWTLLAWNRLMDFPLANGNTILEYAQRYVDAWGSIETPYQTQVLLTRVGFLIINDSPPSAEP